MADVVFDSASGAQGVFVNTIAWAHTISGSDRMLFVTMEFSLIPGMLVTSVTYNGVAMSVLNAQISAGNGIRATTFYLIAPATGTHNIVVNTDNAGDILDCNAASYANVDQVPPPVLTTDIANASPTTTTGVTTVDRSWTILMGTGGQTAGTGSTKRGGTHAQNGALYDSGGIITPAGSYGMTTSDVAQHAWVMAQIAPVTSIPISLDATQGQTATLAVAVSYSITLTATQPQVATLSEAAVLAPTEVSGTTQTTIGSRHVRPRPYTLDLGGPLDSIGQLSVRLPELLSNADIMFQWLFEDLKLVDDALGSGGTSNQGVTAVNNDANITGLISGTTITLGFVGVLAVNRGGSGRATATPYAVICGGIAPDGAHQSVVGVGTAGQVLTSNGPGLLPTWQ